MTPTAALEVPAQGEATTSMKLRNFSGLPGSSYGVFAVLQWSNNGLYAAEKTGTIVALVRPNYTSQYIGVGIAVFLLAAFALYWFVFRKKAGSIP